MSWKRPDPAARMVELLTAERSALGREPAPLDFAAAWDRSWAVMVDERAWPHSTKYRRAWRRAMTDTRSACRDAYMHGDAALREWADICTARRVTILGSVPRP
jgi:hypothetical protein